MLPGGILALDLASNTGWAFATPAACAAWPALPQEPGPIEGVSYGSVRFHQNNLFEVYGAWLSRMLGGDQLGPVYAVLREAPLPKHLSRRSAEVAFGFSSRTEEVCRNFRVDEYEKATSSLRKHFTGSGKGGVIGKRRTLERCRQRGWDPKDLDASDALMVLDWAVFCLANPGERAA